MITDHQNNRFQKKLTVQNTDIRICASPLFALAKMIQWKWPETHGEDKYVVISGGLHLEMGLWHTLGDFLESSGWTAVLVEAEIAKSGDGDA